LTSVIRSRSTVARLARQRRPIHARRGEEVVRHRDQVEPRGVRLERRERKPVGREVVLELAAQRPAFRVDPLLARTVRSA